MHQDLCPEEHHFHLNGNVLHPGIQNLSSRNENHLTWHNPLLHQAERFPQQPSRPVPSYCPAIESAAADDAAFH